VPTLFSGPRDAGTGRDFQTARDFFSSFHRDLKEAKEKVIIFSAFVFPNAVSREAPYLQDLVRRGVKTLVFTKSERERFSQQAEVSALHGLLREIGVRLFPFEGTHHKIAIIDNRILYFGNLNILSWNGEAKELMSRSESPAEIAQLISVLVRENPKLRSILVDGADEAPADVMGQSQPIDLNDLIQKLRSKRKPVGSSKKQIEEYYRKMLKKLRWVIASDKRIPQFAVLYNDTIDSVLRTSLSSKQSLLALKEFQRNAKNIEGYENVVLEIAKEAALAMNGKAIQRE
jgi:phosphatidylserine/phosphatidylglycerophosphate/cardiolipin synthase-like enzyme